jgi:hypothetical protein
MAPIPVTAIAGASSHGRHGMKSGKLEAVRLGHLLHGDANRAKFE